MIDTGSTAPEEHAAGAGAPLPTAPAVVREQPGGPLMRAIVLEKFGGLDSLVYTEIPKPRPLDGEVVIAVKAFGINHAEMHMRRGEWAEAAEVSGIECVGIVDSCPTGEFAVGAEQSTEATPNTPVSAHPTSPSSTPTCRGHSWRQFPKPMPPLGHASSATSSWLLAKPSSYVGPPRRSAKPRSNSPSAAAPA